MVPSASRQCLFWHREICSWLFWGKSAISFDLNRIILGISVWGEQLTDQDYKLDGDFGIKVSVRRAVLVQNIGCLGSCWVISWGLWHCIERLLFWSKYKSWERDIWTSWSADTWSSQDLRWHPRSCKKLRVHLPLRLGREGDKDWTHTELKEVLCHKHSLSHWQVQCLWVTCLTCIWILFSSSCPFWISPVQCSFLEQLHTCKMNLVFFLLSSIKRLKGNLKRSIRAFIWLAQLIFSLMLWASACCWKQVCAHAPGLQKGRITGR